MASLPTLVVLADDLTGAGDCAAYAPAAGLPAVIHVGPPQAPPLQGLTAFALDLRTRPPDEARRQIVATLAPLAGRLPLRCFLLKVDSLLRGSVGASIEAALDALGAPVAVVCPSLPVMNRGVLGGRLVGEALEPIDVAARLAEQTALPTALIPLQTVRRGGETLEEALRAAAAGGARLLLADALADLGLNNIAAATHRALPDALLVGSAGLAAAWLRMAAQPTQVVAPFTLPGDGRVLAVIGSASTLAARQLAAAAGNRVARLELDGAGGAAPEWPAGAWGMLLHLPPLEPGSLLRPHAAGRLVQAAHELLQRERVHRIVVSGGDTARALLDRLAIERLDVLYEAAPGMPVTLGCAADGRLYTIVVKAGGHGDEHTLAHLMRTLHMRRAAPSGCI